MLVLVPDGTRTMPMPLLFDVLTEALPDRVAALDFLVALGTHPPMSDAALSRLVGREVVDGRAGAHRVIEPPLGRPGRVRDARHDPGRGRSATSPAAGSTAT